MSIIVGTGKNARVRLNMDELQNAKGAEKKAQATETPAVGTDTKAKGKSGKGGKNGGKGAKSDAPVAETKVAESTSIGIEGYEGKTKISQSND